MSTTDWVIVGTLVSLSGTALAALYWRRRAALDEAARAELRRQVEASRTPRPYPWQQYERAQSFERMDTVNPKRGDDSHDVKVPPSSRPVAAPVSRHGADDEYDAELARRQRMNRQDDPAPVFDAAVIAAISDVATSNDNAGSSDSSRSSDYSGGGGESGGGGASGEW